jgi:lycopene cyclase domain-containing protein
VTYIGLNLVFLGVAAAVALLAWFTRPASRRLLPASALALAAVLLLTAVFDNIMIGVGLVDYDSALISGLFIGIAPVEDFAYPVAAALLLPAVWALLGGDTAKHHPGTTARPGAEPATDPHQEGHVA